MTEFLFTLQFNGGSFVHYPKRSKRARLAKGKRAGRRSTAKSRKRK